MMPTYLPDLITCLALIVYIWNFASVGRARSTYKIEAPAVTGNPDFERVFRVQQNMVEQLIIFLPLLWIFSMTLSPLWGGVVGAIWVIGRILYSIGYYAKAASRGPGFMISALSSLVLLIGSLVGTIRILLVSI
jgi:glutathione S-transferase